MHWLRIAFEKALPGGVTNEKVVSYLPRVRKSGKLTLFKK